MSSVEIIVGKLSAIRSRVGNGDSASRSLVLRGGLTLADQMIASATTFATGAVIGRVCTKEDFGFYMLGFSLMTFLMTLQSGLVSTPYMIYYPRSSAAERPQLTGNSLLHQLIFGGSTAALILIAAGLAPYFDAVPAMTAMLFGLGIALTFFLARDFVRQVCFAQLDVLRAFLLDSTVAFGQLAVLGLLAVSGYLNAATAFLGLGAACAVGVLGWYASKRTTIRINVAHAKSDFARNWETGKWLFASGLVWSVSMNLYAWLIAGFHGAASVGTWGAALGVVTMMNPLILGFQNFVGPQIMHAYAGGGLNELSKVVGRSAFSFAGVLALLSAALFLRGDFLITLIYGSKYAGGGLLVALLSINLALNALGFCFSRGLFAMNLASMDFKVNFIALVAMLLCGVWMARSYGPIGAALGQIATNCAASLVRGGVLYVALRNARTVSVAP